MGLRLMLIGLGLPFPLTTLPTYYLRLTIYSLLRHGVCCCGPKDGLRLRLRLRLRGRGRGIWLHRVWLGGELTAVAADVRVELPRPAGLREAFADRVELS